MGIYSIAQIKQARTLMGYSANFGTNNGEHEVCDQEAIDYICNWLDTEGSDYITYMSFDNNGTDSDGSSNLFRFCYKGTVDGGGMGSAHSTVNIQGVLVSMLANVGITNVNVTYNASTNYGILTVCDSKYGGGPTFETTNGKDPAPESPEQKAENEAKENMSTTPTPTSGNNTELADPPSEESQRLVDKTTRDLSEFFKDCILLIEGVQIPYNTITVSYGIGNPATCSIIIPAHKVIRELPEDAKIHVFFRDLLADDSGEYKYRLLFDGELSGFSYNTTTQGAYCTIQGIHSCAYTTLMQLMTLEASQYLFTPSSYIAGDATIPILFGRNKMHSTMIKSLLNSEFNSMADLVYQLMRGILQGNQRTGTGKYYQSKLGNDAGGWKVLKRIFGVSKGTAESKIPEADWSSKVADESNKSSNSAGNKPQFTGGGAGTLAWPASGTITSNFGPRTPPCEGASNYHDGIDIGIDVGTPVYAAEAGTITRCEWNDGYGNYIEIDHGNGLVSFYAHLDGFADGVVSGGTVSRGTYIAASGNTGIGSGAHLHFGVHNGGEKVDPMQYLS